MDIDIGPCGSRSKVWTIHQPGSLGDVQYLSFICMKVCKFSFLDIDVHRKRLIAIPVLRWAGQQNRFYQSHASSVSSAHPDRRCTKGCTKKHVVRKNIYAIQFSHISFTQTPTHTAQMVPPKAPSMLLSLPLQSGAASTRVDRVGRRPVNQTGLRTSRPSLNVLHCMPAAEPCRRVHHCTRDG